MTDMTRTMKMIADCDEEVHFERQVKRHVERMKAHIEKLETQLSAATQAPTSEDSSVVDSILPLTMCADQHCPEFGTCYRAQAKPAPDQRFWAVSPREENSCIYYAPIYFTNGATAMKGAR